MSAAGREFLRLRIEMQEWKEVPQEYRNRFEIRRVELENEAYPDDETWIALKKQSAKAYKNLKNYEYDKRHNFRNK